MDCVAALAPGIFTYETITGVIIYIAVDEGVLVKAGTEVMVSVRNAIGDSDLGKLHESVEKGFKERDENETNIGSMMAKMESGFMLRVQNFQQQ